MRDPERPEQIAEQIVQSGYGYEQIKEAIAAAIHAERAQAARALRLAAEATNGWGCYAKRQIEHDDIARLHREIAALREATQEDRSHE